MEMLVLFLFIISLGSIHQAASQDVEIRGPSVVEVAQADLDGGSGVSPGGGQSRTVYGQRHLSPHRMMHFGKKAEERQSPVIYSSWIPPAVPTGFQEPSARTIAVAADPAALMASALMGMYNNRPRQQQQRTSPLALISDGSNYLPYEFSIQLEKSQILQSVPEDTIAQALAQDQASSYQLPVANKRLIYDYVESLPDRNQLTSGAVSGSKDNGAALKSYRQFNGQRSSKLQENDESTTTDNNNNNNNKSDEANNNQHEVNTRSMHRSNTLTLPRRYLSEILYGSQGSPSMPNFGAYNKKAEPKENHFFMHFGRR